MHPRPTLLVSLLFTLLLAACTPPPSDDGEVTIPTELDGEYRGRYWVTHDDGGQQQRRVDGPVSMRFEAGGYQIRGDRDLLPPSGAGDYHIDGRVLVLDDTSMHTADFDWTLILEGRFDLDIGDDGTIRLTQRDLDNKRYHELELRYEGPSSNR